ncbi:MAG TPA: two-component regulator propeller domain-containing protein [Anaerolineae bacterium]|nr:two-component regulator propeller domain-containing protein [Anaerolineae bacterium]
MKKYLPITLLLTILVMISTSYAYTPERMGGDNIQHAWQDYYADTNSPYNIAASDQYVWWYSTFAGTLTRWEKNSLRAHIFTSENGLLDDPTAVMVDRNGHAWVGTYAGLQRFDGQNWHYYTTADGLSNNQIRALTATYDNQIMVINNSSNIDIYHNGQWSHQPIGTNNRCDEPVDVARTANGRLWMANNNASLCYFENGRWEYYGLNEFGLNANSIEAAPDGNLWAADISSINGGGIIRIAPDLSYQHYTMANGLISNEASDITVTSNNTVWATFNGFPAAEQGVASFDGTNWNNYIYFQNFPLGYVQHVAVTPSGIPWFLANEHILGQDGAGWNYALSGPSKNIHYMTTDHDGNLWFGGHGIIRFNGIGWQQFGRPGNLAPTYAMETAVNGDVWIAGNGVIRFDGTNWHVYTTEHGLPSNYPRDITITTNGDIWISFDENVGMARFDGSSWDIFTTTDGLAHDGVETIYGHSDGTLWVGYGDNYEALSVYDGTNWQHFTTADGLQYPEIIDIKADRDNNIWALTRQNISYYNGTDWISTAGSFGYARQIAVDNFNHIWVGDANSTNVFYYDWNSWQVISSAELGNRNRGGYVNNTDTGQVWFRGEASVSLLTRLQVTDQVYLPGIYKR